jgi:hypothetical protein
MLTFHGSSVPVAYLARLLRLTYRAGVQIGEAMEEATPGLHPRQLAQSENPQHRRHDVEFPRCCRSWCVVVRALRPRLRTSLVRHNDDLLHEIISPRDSLKEKRSRILCRGC